MQKKFKSIRVHLAKSEQTIRCGYLPHKLTWVDGKTLFSEYPGGVLVERKHKFLQTQFILTGAKRCMLFTFDEDKKFVTMKPNLSGNDAPFSYYISEPYVLLLPPTRLAPAFDIRSIQILRQ